MARRKAKAGPRLTESAFQRQVVEYARLMGWLVHHTRPARTAKGWRTPIQGHAGFVDLVLVRRGRLLFAELKAEGGRLTPAQQEWVSALNRACTNGCVVWYPEHWPLIAEALR